MRWRVSKTAMICLTFLLTAGCGQSFGPKDDEGCQTVETGDGRREQICDPEPEPEPPKSGRYHMGDNGDASQDPGR